MKVDKISPNASAVQHIAPVTHWSSIWAGAVIALGVVAVFMAAGLGSGAMSIDIESDGWWRVPLSIAGGSGAIALLAALFIGGMVAAWGAGARLRLDGALQGAAVWGVVAVFLTWLTASSAATAVGGVAKTIRGGAQMAGQVMGAGAGALGDLGGGLTGAAKKVTRNMEGDLDASVLLRPVNEKLKQNGRKPIDAQQVERVGKDLFKQGIRDGKLDAQVTIDTVVAKTNISREDAQEVAAQLQAQIAQAKESVGRATHGLQSKAQEASAALQAGVRQHADEVAGVLAKAFWGLFLAMVVSLVTAIGGGLTGAAMRVRSVEG